MIKVIDIDTLFSEYISSYVKENIGKVSPEQIENKVADLYSTFGDKKLKELDGKSPIEYYNSFEANELLKCLKLHLDQGVDVPDFLCEALAKEQNESALIKSIEDDQEEMFTTYVMNLLSTINSQNCFDRYLQFISWDYSQTIKELATEHLREHSDKVKEGVLSLFSQCEAQVKLYLTEILAGCSHDDRVFDKLIEQFINNPNNLALNANYLAKYGDERALAFLMTAIEQEKISYADFQELRFAIEALGGQYDKVRDFKSDKSYKKIKSSKKATPLS